MARAGVLAAALTGVALFLVLERPLLFPGWIPVPAAVTARIPATAPLLGTNATLALLANRPAVYILTPARLEDSLRGTYALIEIRDRGNLDASPDQEVALWRRLRTSPAWDLVIRQEGAWLFKRMSRASGPG
jgi:hypothetical protein